MVYPASVVEVHSAAHGVSLEDARVLAKKIIAHEAQPLPPATVDLRPDGILQGAGRFAIAEGPTLVGHETPEFRDAA